MGTEIPREAVHEIRERIDIVQIISESIVLKKVGSNYKGLCPFHQEKTPSFIVNPTKQLYYCFGCQEGGDVISFLKKTTHQSYPEIVRHLADRVGVTLPEKPLTPKQKEERDRRKELFHLMNQAQAFFVEQLQSPKGSHAKSEILRRGYSEEIISKEGLGFSGAGWEDLVQFFQSKKLPLDKGLELGLFSKNKEGGYYDRFRNRIMFPIYDDRNRLSGFGGRTLSANDPAKYLNSAETPLYRKSQNLYRLGPAKDAIRKSEFAILTEGYFDALAFVAAGFDNVVACCGTAFTAEQANILRKYSGKVLAAFDGDEAGWKATVHAFEILCDLNLKPYCVLFPAQGESSKVDPDTVFQGQGAPGLMKCVEQSKPIIEVIMERLAEHSQKSVPAKSAAIKRMNTFLAMLPSELDRELYRQKTSEAFQVNHRLIQGNPSTKKPAMTKRARKQRLSFEEVLVGILLHKPHWVSEVSRDWVHQGFQDEQLKTLALRIIDDYEQFSELNTSDLMEEFSQVAELTVRTSEYADMEMEDMMARVFRDCISGISEKRKSNLKQELLNNLKTAEASGDHATARKTLEELQGMIEKNKGFEASKNG